MNTMACPIPAAAVIHDLSGLGRCALSVALPTLSVLGVQGCALPTALLSAHTGFPGSAPVDQTPFLEAALAHWAAMDRTFQGVYTGYLAQPGQAPLLAELLADQRRRGMALAVVDPAMADHGKLYPAFGPDFPKAMASVCGQADLVLPNLTEAAFLTGTPYREDWNETEVKGLLEKLLALGCKSAMITGYGGGKGKTGFIAMDGNGKTLSYSHTLLPMSYHGTGDIFSSAVVGGLMRGLGLREAGVIAADFVSRCIEHTSAQPNAPWYGVEFEALLPELMEKLK